MLKGPAPPTTLFQSLTTPNTSGSTSNQVPTLAEFGVPSNLVEHNSIVARLMEGGSLHAQFEIKKAELWGCTQSLNTSSKTKSKNTTFFDHILELFYASGLSQKTEICRTKELRTGPSSICPINCCYHSLSLFSNKRSPYYVHSLKTMKKNGFCFFHQNDKCFQFRKKVRKNLVQWKNQFFQGDHFERI